MSAARECAGLLSGKNTADVSEVFRRNFGRVSPGSSTGCNGGDSSSAAIVSYPIDSNVKTTLDRMLSFPKTLPGLSAPQLREVSQYARYGYGNWTFGSPLPLQQRPADAPKWFSRSIAAQ